MLPLSNGVYFSMDVTFFIIKKRTKKHISASHNDSESKDDTGKIHQSLQGQQKKNRNWKQ